MSKRHLPPVQLYYEAESGDESEQARRPSKRSQVNTGARTSQGARTSGLQVPGLPRPGKTTQGLSTRRSSEPRKSFGTVRNFWRQLEGGASVRRKFGKKRPPSKVLEEPKKVSVGRAPELEMQQRTSDRKSQRKPFIHVEHLTSRRPSQRMPTIREEESPAGSLRETSPQEVESTESLPTHRRISAASEKPPQISVEPPSDDEEEEEEETERETEEIYEDEGEEVQAGPSKEENISGARRISGESRQAQQSFYRGDLEQRTSRPRTTAGSKEAERFSEGQRKPSESRPSRKKVSGDVFQERKSVLRPSTGSQDFERTHRHSAGSYGPQIDQRPSADQDEYGEEAPLNEETISLLVPPQDFHRASAVSIERDKGSRGDGRTSGVSGRMSRQDSYISPPSPPPLPPPPPPLPPTTFLKPPSFWHTQRSDSVTFRRPSILLPVLLDEEKHFHEIVTTGDIAAATDFLEKRPNFNINCTNYQGTSALLIAVKSGNEDMTQFLLAQPNLEIGDAHLYAIRDDHPLILRMILDTFQSINPSLEFMACSNSAEFAENVTPLILAAQAGHYEIIGILLERGHTIPIPHPPRCFCKEECQVLMLTEDPLSVASGKLHIYRALCNPAYICQTSDDPILTAFKLSKELLVCGQVEQTYIRQYEDLAEATRNFAVDIIAECRSLEEVETIISETRGMNLRGTYTYPRLVMAMDLKQKEFVAHPNIQQVLEKTWLGDWVAWKGYRKYIKSLYFLPRIVMLPGILVILMFMPTSSWAKHYALPVNKLLSNVASYSIFLILVFIQSNVDKKNQTRDTKPTGVEIFLAIYVIAFMYNSIRGIIIEGPRRHFGFMWNLYELTMEMLFVLTFIFWIFAAIKTTVTGTKDVERKYWNYLDAELVAEGLFVLASIMAYLKILLICQMSYDLGPLQVSLGKMTNDCAIFSVILGIIILAFTIGLCKFYNYYEGMQQKNPDTGEVDSKQANSFTSFLETFKTLFWGLFGMSSFEVADVVIDNLSDDKGEPTVINEHHFTEAVGYIVFAAYMTLTVIVILNMLIATMSNTFQKVTDNVDTEWAFGRTEVKLCYMNKPVLPPPFNIIPTTRGLVDCCKGAKAKAVRITGIDLEKGLMEQEKKVEEFSVLMSQLVQRYFSTKSDVPS